MPVGLKTNLNTTAYRIFRIMQWLDVEPLSVDELNQRFFEEPLIGKRLSSDSIWLYINTLKALGCKINRPCPSTEFRYVMTHHPFGFLLTPSDQQALAALKQDLSEVWEADEVLAYDQLLKKILQRAAFAQSPQEIERSIGEVFHKSRSVDYAEKQELIDSLKGAIQRGQLLSVGYDSTVNGQGIIEMLPCGLVYENGVLYLRGMREEVSEPVSLRVERLFQMSEIRNPGLQARLQEKLHTQPRISVRLYMDDLRQHKPWFMGEQAEFVNAGEQPYMEIHLYSRDFFQVRQKLLASGCVFRVDEPLGFREEMATCLQEMCKLYEDQLP